MLVFVAIVACLRLRVNAEMEIMAGVRVYVEGESPWSKNPERRQPRQLITTGGVRMDYAQVE